MEDVQNPPENPADLTLKCLDDSQGIPREGNSKKIPVVLEHRLYKHCDLLVAIVNMATFSPLREYETEQLASVLKAVLEIADHLSNNPNVTDEELAAVFDDKLALVYSIRCARTLKMETVLQRLQRICMKPLGEALYVPQLQDALGIPNDVNPTEAQQRRKENGVEPFEREHEQDDDSSSAGSQEEEQEGNEGEDVFEEDN